MSHVLTLISEADPDALSSSRISDVCSTLPSPGTPDWLAPGRACDIVFAPSPGAAAVDAEARARGALKGLPVDVVVQPVADRRKRLLIADMDSTIIQQECIDEIADFAGVKAQVAGITERAMRGELVFEAALRERVGLLKGLPDAVLQRVIDERIQLTPGARALVQTMRANGAFCVLVSGGFTFFTSRIAQQVGFEENQANTLEIADGALTGRVGEPILGRDAKLEALRRLRRERELRHEQTLAIGDGANDLAMIKEAGLGVAFQAKPIVAAEAAARIDHGSLRSVLYLQGYREAEIVT
ncbi:MAG: phosphoserine phosphatase SerB [Methyloligellaceae bacterium]